jgi:hypothetical protein
VTDEGLFQNRIRFVHLPVFEFYVVSRRPLTLTLSPRAGRGESCPADKEFLALVFGREVARRVPEPGSSIGYEKRFVGGIDGLGAGAAGDFEDAGRGAGGEAEEAKDEG